jgi:tetratricopeptide (TPR) repeat protein
MQENNQTGGCNDMLFNSTFGGGDSQRNQRRDSDSLYDFYIDSGYSAAREGDLEIAAKLYEEAVHSQPDSALAWYNYGDALASLKRFDDAEVALRRAVGLSPENLLYRYNLGLVLLELERNAEAKEEFVSIVEHDPQLQYAQSTLLVSSITNLAISQEKMGERDSAIATLTPALQEAVNIVYNLGYLHFKAKRYSEALRFFQSAAALQKDDEAIMHMTGATLIGLKRPKEAVKLLRQVIRINPNSAYAWYDLGLAFARLNKRRLARAHYRRSLRLNPKHVRSHYNLACLDALERRPAAAFRNLQNAIASGLKDAAALQQDADLKYLHADARWPSVVTQVCGADQNFKNQ